MKQVTLSASTAASVITGEFRVAVIVVPLNEAGFQFDTVGRGTTQHRTPNSAANPSASQAKPHPAITAVRARCDGHVRCR